MFTAVTIPDFIAKGDAGGEAIGFSRRLRPAHYYIEGKTIEHGVLNPMGPCAGAWSR